MYLIYVRTREEGGRTYMEICRCACCVGVVRDLYFENIDTHKYVSNVMQIDGAKSGRKMVCTLCENKRNRFVGSLGVEEEELLGRHNDRHSTLNVAAQKTRSLACLFCSTQNES